VACCGRQKPLAFVSRGRKAPKLPEVVKRPVKGGGTPVELARELLDSRAPRDIRKLLADERKRLVEFKRFRISEVRASCKTAKIETRKRRAAQRAKLLRMWAQAQRAELDRHAKNCEAERAAILQTYAEGRERNRAIAQAVKRERSERAAMAKRHRKPADIKKAIRAREKRGEALDEARNEVEAVAPELLAYFDKVKARLRKAKKMSLAETFFHDAEAHPEQVIAAREHKSERDVKRLIETGEERWKSRHEKIQGMICERATKAARAGKLFQLKASEEKALAALGIAPGPLMARCYNAVATRRRKVSQRLAPAPF